MADLVVRHDAVEVGLQRLSERFDFLANGQCPIRFEGSIHRNSRKSWKRETNTYFVLENDILYHRSQVPVRQRTGPAMGSKRRRSEFMPDLRPVMMNSDQLAIALWEAHDSPVTGGHDMVQTVMTKLSRKFYLPGGARHLVESYCRTCCCQVIQAKLALAQSRFADKTVLIHTCAYHLAGCWSTVQ